MTLHEHSHPIGVGSKLKYGIIFTAGILVLELIGGVLSNSLALLSDAGHVLTDIVALALSWYGVRQAERPPTHRMTFGYHRVGVLIAIINALSIFLIAGIVFYEAYRRWQNPPEVNSVLMLVIAVVGLAVNIFVAFWLSREQRGNINVRSAFWHALGDALASLGVIIGGIIILLTDWYFVDPLVSAFIGAIIALAAWRILKEGMKVLLEASPANVDVNRMVSILSKIPGVKDVHDVHVWSISPELHAMSCHVLIDDIATSQAALVRERIEKVLRDEFQIGHSALQMECQACSENDLFCSLKPCEPGTVPAHEHEEHEDHSS
ncbi:MAG: cation diffusion facilitator family transporter [Dehalococcoidales bacterium]|nr:cation diffusion facilitator family transporter [Dehalococcoidales bacterium]